MDEIIQDEEEEKPQILTQLILVFVVAIMVMVFFLGM